MMSSRFQNRGVPSFSHFLEYLRLNKFRVDIAHYALMQQVLDRTNEDCRLNDLEYLKSLKLLLRPLFASSAEEQHRFTKLYDKYIEHCRETFGIEGVGSKGEAKEDRGPTFGMVRTDEGWQQTARALDDMQRGQRRLSLGFLAIIICGAAVVLGITLLFLINLPLDTTVNRNGIPTSSPVPTASVSPPLPTPTPLPSVEKQSTPLSPVGQQPQAIPLNPTPLSSVGQQPQAIPLNPTPLFYFAVAAAMLLNLLLYALLRRSLRALDPANYENKKPPFRWPLPAAAPVAMLYDSEDFRRAAYLLHRRQVDEFFNFDLDATVSATIHSLGYPSFRYKPATRVPEYLALIERASPHDHQARLFDEMVKALKREGLIIKRYFYGDDPLVCYDVSSEQCIRLEWLKQRHRDHRLLLFGNGGHLLDPLTGRLAEWTSVFFNWRERAVLTPESNWGWREQVLSEKFVVVPADARGLHALIDRIESIPGMSWDAETHNAPRTLLRDTIPPLTLDATRDHVRWISSCAIYPELHWELTLMLGALPLMPKGIVNEVNLLRLSRLPWFRKGIIPDTERLHLLKALESAWGDQARALLVMLLEASPPPPDTYASDAHGLELALQRWLLLKDKKSLNALRHALKKFPTHYISRSEVLTHVLNVVPHKLFGQRLPNIFYKHSLPALGFSMLAHLVLFIALLASALIAIRVWKEDLPRWAYTSFDAAMPTPTAPPTLIPFPSPSSRIIPSTGTPPASVSNLTPEDFPSSPWNIHPFIGRDFSGKSIELRVDILPNEVKWEFGSSDGVELNGRGEDLRQYIRRLDLSSAKAIVCVGVASSEGERVMAENLARRRIEKLRLLVREEIYPAVPLYGLNLGQFKDRGSSMPDSNLGTTQRPVVIIEIVSLDAGVNLSEALKSALSIKSNPFSAFNTDNYSFFKLSPAN